MLHPPRPHRARRLFADAGGIYLHDWRYAIGFDAPLARAVDDAARSLADPREREQLRRVAGLSAARTSLAALVEALERRPETVDLSDALDRADADRLLGVPWCLHEHFVGRIGALASCIGARAAGRLRGVLDDVVGRPEAPSDDALLDAWFGEDAGRVRRHRLMHAPPYPPPPQAASIRSVDRAAARFLRAVPRARRVHAAFGPSPSVPLDVEVRAHADTFEYWPQAMLEGPEGGPAPADLLRVNANARTRRRDYLRNLLLHEVYPGHGHFYHRAAATGTFVDYGAMPVIEGWAVWAAARCAAPAMAAMERASWRYYFACDAAPVSYTAPLPRAGRGERAGVDRWELLGALYRTQYPGYDLAYAAGALWFDMRWGDRRPGDFLDALRGRAWGDFFGCWRDL